MYKKVGGNSPKIQTSKVEIETLKKSRLNPRGKQSYLTIKFIILRTRNFKLNQLNLKVANDFI